MASQQHESGHDLGARGGAFAAILNLGAGTYLDGRRDFADWSRKMAELVGREIEPLLEPLFRQSKVRLRERLGEVLAGMPPTDPRYGRYTALRNELADSWIRGGEPLPGIPAVPHEDRRGWQQPWKVGPPITDQDEKLRVLLGFDTVDQAMKWLASDAPLHPEDQAQLLQAQRNQEDRATLEEYELTGEDPDAKGEDDEREAWIAAEGRKREAQIAAAEYTQRGVEFLDGIAFSAPAVAAVVMLFSAALRQRPWPYFFYEYLRLICLVGAVAMISHARRAGSWTWTAAMFSAGILLNPLVPVTMSRSHWRIADLVAAVAFLLATSFVTKPDNRWLPEGFGYALVAWAWAAFAALWAVLLAQGVGRSPVAVLDGQALILVLSCGFVSTLPALWYFARGRLMR